MKGVKVPLPKAGAKPEGKTVRGPLSDRQQKPQERKKRRTTRVTPDHKGNSGEVGRPG